MHDCELQDREVVDRQLLETGEDAPALLEPADTAFDESATSIGVTVERLEFFVIDSLVGPVGDDGVDAALTQPFADPRDAVRLVGSQTLGAVVRAVRSSGEPKCIEHLQEEGRVVRLPRADLDCERDSLAIRDEMDFRAETAARTA